MKKLIHRFKPYFLVSKSERVFHWIGLSPLGELKSGQMTARNRAAAKQTLREQTIIIKKLSSSWAWTRTLRRYDITQMLQ